MNVLCKRIESENEFIDAIRLRVDVFIREQGFQPGWEPDEDDKISEQYIASVNDNIVCTVRVRETNPGELKIERMVTRKDYRRKGVGTRLVEHVLQELLVHKPKRIW